MSLPKLVLLCFQNILGMFPTFGVLYHRWGDQSQDEVSWPWFLGKERLIWPRTLLPCCCLCTEISLLHTYRRLQQEKSRTCCADNQYVLENDLLWSPKTRQLAREKSGSLFVTSLPHHAAPRRKRKPGGVNPDSRRTTGGTGHPSRLPLLVPSATLLPWLVRARLMGRLQQCRQCPRFRKTFARIMNGIYMIYMIYMYLYIYNII